MYIFTYVHSFAACSCLPHVKAWHHVRDLTPKIRYTVYIIHSGNRGIQMKKYNRLGRIKITHVMCICTHSVLIDNTKI
jgi:hypothetical protein